MIRTNVVELNVIPAIAYRQKLPSGGAGVTILMPGVSQPGLAEISRTSGGAIVSANTPAGTYPAEAFQEAISLTAGMPYRRLGSVRLTDELVIEEAEPQEAEPEALREDEVVIDSEDYRRLVERYTDKRGRLSYELLNRDLIRTAHDSGQVRLMIEERAPADDILVYITRAQLRQITRDPTLTDPQVRRMIELLDEVSPKGVLRPLSDEVRQWLRQGRMR